MPRMAITNIYISIIVSTYDVSFQPLYLIFDPRDLLCRFPTIRCSRQTKYFCICILYLSSADKEMKSLSGLCPSQCTFRTNVNTVLMTQNLKVFFQYITVVQL